MAYADMQDICFDGSDLIEETISAFSRLLQDEAKMKVFIFDTGKLIHAINQKWLYFSFYLKLRI